MTSYQSAHVSLVHRAFSMSMTLGMREYYLECVNIKSRASRFLVRELYLQVIFDREKIVVQIDIPTH